jgi:hypothetical protein
VYTVHVAEGAIPPDVVTIGSITGGGSFASADKESLAGVFKRIDQMQKTRLEKTHAEVSDDFIPYAFAGLGILSVFLLAAFGLRNTPW